MLFTLVVWVITAIGLLAAIVLYLMFLWHYIPSADGTLSRYCRRKVDTRLERIVNVKVKKALAKQEAKRIKEERKEFQKEAAKTGEKPQYNRQPTLPSIAGSDDATSDYSLARQDSVATLPAHTSPLPSRSDTMSTARTGMSRQPTLPDIGISEGRPRPPLRTDTQSSAFSTTSYGSNAPLLGDASPMGYGDPGRSSPAPPLPPLDTSMNFSRPPMPRSMTPGSQQRPYSPASGASSGPGPSPVGMRSNGYGPPRTGPIRQNTGFTDGRNSPGPVRPGGPMSRQNTFNSIAGRRTPGPSPLTSDPSFSPYDRRGASGSPGPSYEMSPVDQSNLRQPPYSNNSNSASDYDPYRPVSPPQRIYSPQANGPSGRNSPLPQSRSVSPPSDAGGNAPPRPLPSAVLQSAMQRRELSNPLPSRAGASSVPPQAFQRSVTAPMGTSIGPPASFGPSMYPQTRPPVPRSATAGPAMERQPQMNDWQGYPPGHANEF
jgi:hypothetical protein